MDAWDAALEFLSIGDRAQSLADAHPLLADGRCGSCNTPGCAAAELASAALAVVAKRPTPPAVPPRACAQR